MIGNHYCAIGIRYYLNVKDDSLAREYFNMAKGSVIERNMVVAGRIHQLDETISWCGAELALTAEKKL